MGRWRPSKAKAREFADTMDSIRDYCNANGIDYSASMDSYYFTVGGQKYRVSNHTVAASNRKAFDDMYGQTRELYHPGGEREDTTYITAGKTRIIDIHKALLDGKKLDRRGYVKEDRHDTA